MTPDTQEGLPALATDEREVEDLMRVILRAWKPCSSPQGHPHMEWAEIAARAVHKERAARLEAAERQVKELREALSETLAFAIALEKHSSKGTGGRRGGPIFARARTILEAKP